MPMLKNFINDPMFVPLVIRVFSVLAVALAALVIRALLRGNKLTEDILIKRWCTWFMIAIVLMVGFLSGALPMILILTAMIVQGLREFARLVKLPTLYRRVLLLTGGVMPIVTCFSQDLFYLAAPVFLVFATLQPLRSFPDNPHAVRDLAFAALGWGYIAWFLTHLMMIHLYISGGPGLLIALTAGVAFSDIGAYTFGTSFGRKKLAPAISPNKTMAGGIGNIVGAYLGFILMYFAVPDNLPPVLIIVLPLLVAAGSLWGDLVESVLKREFEVKDAGDWLPGFGGLLDRIDSLILVAPIAYYVVRLAT